MKLKGSAVTPPSIIQTKIRLLTYRQAQKCYRLFCLQYKIIKTSNKKKGKTL